MTLSTVAIWVRYSERAFAFNFIAFSFVMFSCGFPTGFSATFSTLAFLFALPIFFYRFALIKLSLLEQAGLLLFGWLTLSVVWSQTAMLNSFGYLSEYRIYFMLPVFITALTLNEKTQRLSVYAGMAGALFALAASYGLGLGWLKVEGANLSLANRIYHGFIMSSFLLLCLLIARERLGITRILALIVALLIIVNVLTIETGRTGYLQILVVLFVFGLLSFPLKTALKLFFLFGFFVTSTYIFSDRFQARVNETIINIERSIDGDNLHTSTGQRIEFYRGALAISSENLVAGVGVGDVTSALEQGVASGKIRLKTDNVHNEFLNMLLAGGLPGLTLFVGFLGAIGYVGSSTRRTSKGIGDMMIGLLAVISVAALFNSTIKDYGEKHALIVMLSIIGAQLRSLETFSAKDYGKVHG